MSQTPASPGAWREERRKSQRVYLAVPLEIYWEDAGQEKHWERGTTEVISSTGTIVRVKRSPTPPAEILLTHLMRKVSTQARVVTLLPMQEEGVTRVAIELAEPSDTFWGVSLPPAPQKA